MSLSCFRLRRRVAKHETGGLPVKYFGGANALFSYVNLQVNYYFGGKTMQNCSIGGILPQYPLQVVA